MDQKDIGGVVKNVLLGLVFSIMTTVVLTLLLAFVLYIGGFGKSTLNVSVVIIYILSLVVGGWMAGHRTKFRKFIWGAMVGCLYLIVVFGLSVISGEEAGVRMSIAGALTCIGSGMLGGMFG